MLPILRKKIVGRYQRAASDLLHRRPFRMVNRRPLISFTFDDFPRSALTIACPILERHGFRGTYYTSLGLMGTLAPTGEIFQEQDLPLLVQRGHELGCHTYSHCHSYDTLPAVFEKSIEENARALREILPGARFRTLSYPLSSPRPETKRMCARYFVACRGGGQTYNADMLDLSHLRAFFLEQARGLEEIDEVIAANDRAQGWLIFATHDVADRPTQYGCTPAFFEAVVQRAQAAGAEVCSVGAACEKLLPATSSKEPEGQTNVASASALKY